MNKLSLFMETIAELAKVCLKRFRDAQMPSLPSPTLSSCWQPPALGSWKVNFHAAMFAFGVGTIIRNNNGELVAGLTNKFNFFPDPSTAKILFMVDCDIRHVFIEEDILSVINAIKSLGFYGLPFGHIIVDVKYFSSHFRSCN